MINIDKISDKLTPLEMQVLTALVNELYAEPGFSDVGVDELSEATGLSKNVVKGVVGSLTKKGIVSVDEEFDGIVYLDSKYYYLHPEWSKEINNESQN